MACMATLIFLYPPYPTKFITIPISLIPCTPQCKYTHPPCHHLYRTLHYHLFIPKSLMPIFSNYPFYSSHHHVIFLTILSI